MYSIRLFQVMFCTTFIFNNYVLCLSSTGIINYISVRERPYSFTSILVHEVFQVTEG